jgi:hypothetical protein
MKTIEEQVREITENIKNSLQHILGEDDGKRITPQFIKTIKYKLYKIAEDCLGTEECTSFNVDVVVDDKDPRQLNIVPKNIYSLAFMVGGQAINGIPITAHDFKDKKEVRTDMLIFCYKEDGTPGAKYLFPIEYVTVNFSYDLTKDK